MLELAYQTLLTPAQGLGRICEFSPRLMKDAAGVKIWRLCLTVFLHLMSMRKRDLNEATLETENRRSVNLRQMNTITNRLSQAFRATTVAKIPCSNKASPDWCVMKSQLISFFGAVRSGKEVNELVGLEQKNRFIGSLECQVEHAKEVQQCRSQLHFLSQDVVCPSCPTSSSFPGAN